MMDEPGQLFANNDSPAASDEGGQKERQPQNQQEAESATAEEPDWDKLAEFEPSKIGGGNPNEEGLQAQQQNVMDEPGQLFANNDSPAASDEGGQEERQPQNQQEAETATAEEPDGYKFDESGTFKTGQSTEIYKMKETQYKETIEKLQDKLKLLGQENKSLKEKYKNVLVVQKKCGSKQAIITFSIPETNSQDEGGGNGASRRSFRPRRVPFSNFVDLTEIDSDEE